MPSWAIIRNYVLDSKVSCVYSHGKVAEPNTSARGIIRLNNEAKNNNQTRIK